MGYQQTTFYVSISNSYTNITSADDLATKKAKIKDWFATNDTKIYFPLEKTVEIPIELPIISKFTGTTIVSVNTSVKPSIQVLYK